MKTLISALAGLVALGAAGNASAGLIYDYSISYPPGSDKAGDITHFSTRYDSHHQTLDYKVTLKKNTWSSFYADSGWVVLSPGPNPKGISGELAILYMDFNGGDVYAYNYNGVNGDTSWQNSSAFIRSYQDVLTVEQNGLYKTVSFTSPLDVTDIQNYVPAGGADDWTGVEFGERIGVWSHYSNLYRFDTKTTSNGDVRIKKWDTKSKVSWYDDKYEHTTIIPKEPPVTVSEPVGVALFGLVAVGFVASRRRRAAAAA